MMTLFEANAVAFGIALLIGLVVGWWAFRRLRKAQQARSEVKPSPSRAKGRGDEYDRMRGPPSMALRKEGREGSGLADEAAAATADVAGEILSVEAHPDLPAASGPPDNLQTLKGVGPKLAARLQENGITRFDQLAGLSANEVAILDQRMGPFRGRLQRDRIVEQASYLARGDVQGFEARFGKLGGGSLSRPA